MPSSHRREHSSRGFASEGRRPALSSQERWTVIAVSLAVCAPPWFLGGMRWWQQLIFLVLALVAFASAFLPNGATSVRERVVRLMKFPVFWITLAFLAYILIGAFNYSWEYVLSDGGAKWKMVRLPAEDYIGWLPQGVKTPFTNMSPWRVLINFTTGLLLASAIWTGMSRRRAIQILIGIIALNAFLVALLVILQQLSNTELIYWHFKPANSQFAGPFHYRNHTSAYLYLGLAAAFGSAFLHWRRMREEALTSSPAPLFAFFAFVILVSLFFAASRAGILFGLLITCVAVVIFLKTIFVSGRQGLILLSAAILACCIGLYFSWPLLQRAMPELKVRFEQTERMFDADIKDDGNSLGLRGLLTRATLDMWKARPWLGWGGGSYRFLFPKFQQEYPELYYSSYTYHRWLKNPKLPPSRMAVYYAHNDWVQALAEYGIVGTSLLTLTLLFWAFLGVRHFRELTVDILMLYVGAGALMLHALVDFPLWNPPTMMLFVTLLALAGTQLSISTHRQNA